MKNEKQRSKSKCLGCKGYRAHYASQPGDGEFTIGKMMFFACRESDSDSGRKVACVGGGGSWSPAMGGWGGSCGRWEKKRSAGPGLVKGYSFD